MKVELLAHTPTPDKLIAAAAKLCYAKSDIDTLLDNLTPEKTESFLGKRTIFRLFPILRCSPS